MRTRMGIAATLLLVLLPLNTLEAQEYGVRGVAPPSAVNSVQVTDTSLVRLFNSVEVLGEGFVGAPLVFVRIVGVWGPWAGMGSGALTTKVYVAVNLDGIHFAVFELSELLDPEVQCVRSEYGAAVAYMTYGFRDERHLLRIEASTDGLVLSQGQTGKCP